IRFIRAKHALGCGVVTLAKFYQQSIQRPISRFHTHGSSLLNEPGVRENQLDGVDSKPLTQANSRRSRCNRCRAHSQTISPDKRASVHAETLKMPRDPVIVSLTFST